MLVHVEIPDMSLNLQDPLLRLTGIHPRQTGGPLFCQILTDFARGGRRANSTPGPARGIDISEKCIPKTSTNPKKSNPWYNDDCKEAIKQRKETLSRFCKFPTKDNLNTY